jgi:hypothetical protein
MAELTAVLGALIALVTLAALLAGLFMYVGAKLAMVPTATFGRAVLAAIGCTIADWTLTAAFSPVPLLGSCSGFIIGLAGSMVIIMLVFETSIARAFLVWAFHLLAQIVALFIILLLFAGSLLSFFTLPLAPG